MAVLTLVLCFIQLSVIESRRYFRNDFADEYFKDLWYEDGYDRMVKDNTIQQDEATDTMTALKDNTIQQDEATDKMTALKGIFEKFPAGRKAGLLGKVNEIEKMAKTLQASLIPEIKGIKGDGAADSLVGITASLGGFSMNKQIEILKAVIVQASTLPMEAQKKIAFGILADYIYMPTYNWANEPRDALLKPLATGMFPESTSSEKIAIFQKIEDVLKKEKEEKLKKLHPSGQIEVSPDTSDNFTQKIKGYLNGNSSGGRFSPRAGRQGIKGLNGKSSGGGFSPGAGMEAGGTFGGMDS